MVCHLHDFVCRDCSESLKESIARALRHSRAEASRTYDRRGSSERKQSAVRYAQSQAQSVLGEPGSDEESPKCGDFVGVVEEDSSLKQPKVMIGQVNYYREEDVHLLYYKAVPSKRNVCTLCLDGNPWTESKNSLVPVKMRGTKIQGEFRLYTPPREIHNKVFGPKT